MLIVNADDLGLDVPTTDAILSCFKADRISSASAMVWMADSDRAATLARQSELPVSLHLNLTEPFTDPLVPACVQQRQASIARYFDRSHITYWLFNPIRHSLIAKCIADQIQAFEALYGASPVAVDGHRHVHTCPNVIFARSLGDVRAMRATFTFLQGEKGWANRSVRTLTNAMLRLRFGSTEHLASLRGTDSRFGDSRLKERISLARTTTVELITHPGVLDEYEFLMSDEWWRMVAGAAMGTFHDLS